MGGSRAREKVHQIYNSLLLNISGSEDVRARKVALLGSVRRTISQRSYAKVSAFVFIEKPAEDGRRVEFGPIWSAMRL